jgi:hypothetical protein
LSMEPSGKAKVPKRTANPCAVSELLKTNTITDCIRNLCMAIKMELTLPRPV